MRRLLIFVVLLTGCRSFGVNAFGVPLARQEPKLMAAAETEPDHFPLWKILAIVAADVGIGILIHEATH